MVKIAFKKAFHHGWFDGWYGFIIMLRTMSLYCHAEEVFSDGQAFSARDKGADFDPVDISKKEQWDIIDIDPRDFVNPFTGKNYGYEAELREVCEFIADPRNGLNDGYDWDNIIVHEGMNHPAIKNKKWYCSEVIAFSLGLNDFEVNPGELCSVLKTMLSRLRKNPYQFA